MRPAPGDAALRNGHDHGALRRARQGARTLSPHARAAARGRDCRCRLHLRQFRRFREAEAAGCHRARRAVLGLARREGLGHAAPGPPAAAARARAGPAHRRA